MADGTLEGILMTHPVEMNNSLWPVWSDDPQTFDSFLHTRRLSWTCIYLYPFNSNQRFCQNRKMLNTQIITIVMLKYLPQKDFSVCLKISKSKFKKNVTEVVCRAAFRKNIILN